MPYSGLNSASETLRNTFGTRLDKCRRTARRRVLHQQVRTLIFLQFLAPISGALPLSLPSSYEASDAHSHPKTRARLTHSDIWVPAATGPLMLPCPSFKQ